MQRKIAIINQDSGYLMIDIANAYADAGYDVALLTGRLVQRNIMLNPNVKLDKIIRYNRSSIFGRIFSWTIAFLQILSKVLYRYRKSQLFIVSNPPISPLIPLFCRNSFLLLIYDVYIEKLSQYTILKERSPLVFLWKKMHSMVFARATKIVTLTEGMKQTLEKYTKGKTVEIVPLWTDNEFLKPIDSDENPFVLKFGLSSYFIVLYSGNLGASSGAESILEIASHVHCEEIKFVIIGEGIKKEYLRNRIKSLSLNNCVLLPWQEPDVLPFSLASSDLSIVALAGNSSNNSIPSKLFNYISVGAPILCLANPDSDVAKMVIREGIGECFEPDQLKETAEFILKMYSAPDELRQFQINSLNTSKKFTRENAKSFLLFD